MRHLIALVVLLLAIVSAATAYFYSTPSTVPFEEAMVVAEMKESGPQMQAALAQYPDAAPRVFALYGQTPEFAEVMKRFGHNQTVPIIAKCLEEGDAFLETSNDLKQLIGSLWQEGEWIEPESLDPIECGWRTILLVQTLGNDFLGRFVIDEDGKAKRLPGSTVAAALKEFVTSGLQKVEKRLVLGETPKFSEWGLAALDVAVIGLAGKSVAVLAKGRLAAKASAGTRFAAARQGIAGFAKAVTPKVAKYGSIVGVGYLAMYHPSVITGAATTIAEVLGAPVWLVQGVVWGVILYFPITFLAGLLYACSRPIVWGRRAMRAAGTK